MTSYITPGRLLKVVNVHTPPSVLHSHVCRNTITWPDYKTRFPSADEYLMKIMENYLNIKDNKIISIIRKWMEQNINSKIVWTHKDEYNFTFLWNHQVWM